jgi:hypothetical protein
METDRADILGVTLERLDARLVLVVPDLNQSVVSSRDDVPVAPTRERQANTPRESTVLLKGSRWNSARRGHGASRCDTRLVGVGSVRLLSAVEIIDHVDTLRVPGERKVWLG